MKPDLDDVLKNKIKLKGGRLLGKPGDSRLAEWAASQKEEQF